MCAGFGSLGFAHCSFKDCSKAKIVAVFLTLSNIALPNSYKSLIIYYVGHGKDGYINVEGGFIEISKLVEELSGKDNHQLKELAKVLIFDCCRKSSGPAPPQFTTPKNMMVLYTAAREQESFLDDARGMTKVGIELLKLLEREESCCISKLFLVELNTALSEAGRTYMYQVNGQCCMLSDPDLYMEKLKASKST